MSLDLTPIIERRQELEQVIHELERRIAQAPPGHLVISRAKRGNQIKYNRSIRVSQNGRRVERRFYISKKDMALARALATKGYHEKVLKAVQEEYRVISRFLNYYPKEVGEDIYPKLAEERKALIEPYWEPAEEFLNRWLKEEYPGKSFREEDAFYITARGERVRSKSELIIADWLYRHGIPYRYESPLKLMDPDKSRIVTIYPDFTILDPVSGKCFYLEHFGMMSDETYFRSAMDRLALYEANGFYMGESLIISFESDKVPLNIRKLGQRIEHYLHRDA